VSAREKYLHPAEAAKLKPIRTAAGWRTYGPSAMAVRSLFLLTRSNAVLDLAAVGTEEAIILCPANYSPPTQVLPVPGAPGFEAVATCLGTPEARARTEGVVAMRLVPGMSGVGSNRRQQRGV
jgi:hypothetical protein